MEQCPNGNCNVVNLVVQLNRNKINRRTKLNACGEAPLFQKNRKAS